MEVYRGPVINERSLWCWEMARIRSLTKTRKGRKILRKLIKQAEEIERKTIENMWPSSQCQFSLLRVEPKAKRALSWSCLFPLAKKAELQKAADNLLK